MVILTSGREPLKAAIAFLALFTALLLSSLALAAELPKLTGRVVDNAGMIDPADDTALTQKLEDFEKKSTDQIVVATIDSLNGEAIESYANRLFREWHLGQAGENNGILLLVAKVDRKMRIEVGYGLEGTLTDLHSKLIIENTMLPAFRAGDFSGGISRAVDDIIMVLEGNAAELEARYKRNQPSAIEDVDWVAVVFIALFLTIFLGAMAMAILPPIFGKRIGRNRYRWLGMDITTGGGAGGWSSGRGGGWSSGGGGWSSGGGGFSGGGGSSGGGGASGSW
ncbi:YgcG family protein [Pseudaminobacter sp. 19-2017]|uniref:YgcG family protein n=1 Tax=Pseudaminobacter soli (ex Zhang et al. 2022) TaxID=2831468 RepID=A0A942I879_9HYPH|nr:YgcG family protein [Pseudaminobacter soli]MBS3647916.1 YgcG family protein [Pseudaminobacter soli]